MNWLAVKLGSICVKDGVQTGPFGSQLHQSDYSNVGIPVVMPVNLVDGRISSARIAHVSNEHVKRLEKYQLHSGDIVYARRGDVGRCARVTENEEGWLCGTGCLRLTGDPDKVDSDFLFYALSNREVISWVKSHAVGATMPNLNTTILENVPLTIPNSIERQKWIAAILDAYDKLIENNRKQIALLEEAAQRLYKEWFVDMRFPGYSSVNIQDGLPQGWERCMLPEFADIQYGFAFHADNFNTSRDGRPIVRIRNVPTGYSSDYTTEVADEKYIVKDGDILIGMDGVFYINLWHGGDAYLVQRTCCVRPKIEAYRGYIEQAVREPIAAFQNGIVGATVAHLGKKHLDSIHIVVPPAALVGPLDVMAQQRLTLSKEIVMLSEARDRLLPKLMSGEIEV